MQLKPMILSILLLFSVAMPCLAKPTTVSPEEKQAVEQATAQFYRSLNVMFTGDATPMLDVWSHSNDITYMGPAGRIQIGWEAIRAVWISQAGLNLGGDVQPEEMHTTVGQDLAVVICREIGSNVDASGEPVQVSIRATNVFRKENGQWKMIGHHTDLLPFLEQISISTPNE